MTKKMIDEMLAYVVIDPTDHTEGIPAFLGEGGQWLPMVGADMDRMTSLRDKAQRIADQMGLPLQLIRFTNREAVDLIEPTQGVAVDPNVIVIDAAALRDESLDHL